jgi:tRNA1(Val) A37 N6-methylase TrmN6
MARSVARLKMGFYPLPEREAANIRSLLSYSSPCSVIDPCTGKGTAFNLIAAHSLVNRYGIELDTERARLARETGIRMIQGNTFDAHTKVESFSLLCLNPPYDSEINLTGNRRMERLFLEHTHRWLVPDGILVFVIPFEQLNDCANLLSAAFTREKWSNELRLIYACGRTMKLTETVRSQGDGNGECSPSNGSS